MTSDLQIETRPDIDLADGSFYAGDSRAAYAWMRANEPVFRDRDGLAGAATYRAVIEAERNPELFSNAGGIRPDYVPPVPMMIDQDDPAHLRRRKLVNAGFTRKRVSNLGQSIAALCDELIDAVCERGECDFVWDLAAPLPMAVIGDMLGVRPDQRDMFLKWSDDLVTSLSSRMAEQDLEVTMNAYLAFTDYTRDLIERRRKEPTEDLISVLVHGVIDGERLSDDEIIQDALLILVGGRRDLTAHPQRRHCAASQPSWPTRCSSRGPRRSHRQHRRGNAAVDLAGEEHVPNADRGHRFSRHRAESW